MQVAAHPAETYGVRLHVHDCGRRQTDYEGVYCTKVLVDAWRVKSHKCSCKRFDPAHSRNKRVCAGCNTEAAEQLWKLMDPLAHFVNAYSRKYFRLFIRE